MKVIKRDGHMVEYCPEKIENAILKANRDVAENEKVSSVQIRNIIKYIESLGKKRILVEDIQDIIEMKLMSIGKFVLAKKYITYRYTRELVRRSNTTDVAIKNLIDSPLDDISNNANKNIQCVFSQRDYLAGITSTDITKRFLLPEDIVNAHDEGVLYFHDMEYFAQNALCNSSFINLFDILNNGSVINGINIDKPKDFKEAISKTIQVLLAASVSQYGGITINLGHLSPFVVESYKRYLKKYQSKLLNKELALECAANDLEEEIIYGVKTLLYGISTIPINDLNSRPVSIFMYLNESERYIKERALLIEKVFLQMINDSNLTKKKIKKMLAPKLIYVLSDNNLKEDSQYYYLTELAIESLSKNFNPDFISEKVFRELNNNEKKNIVINGNIILPLTEENTISDHGKFNQGIVTLNLLDVALSSDKDINLFWDLLDEKLELCHRAMQIRHKRLSKVSTLSAPILWSHGAISRLDINENIHDLLHNEYSSISLGFMGLYECVKYIKERDYYTDDDSMSFATKILERLKFKCKTWAETEKISYIVCGIQNERTSSKFITALKDRFGEIRSITDKNYITASYQIPNDLQINLLKKVEIESSFQKLIGNGVITIDCYKSNDFKKSINQILSYIYDKSLYTQINIINDVCLQCGYNGELLINDNYKWECPKCKNNDIEKINVFRRLNGRIISDNAQEKTLDRVRLNKIFNLEEMEW